LFLPEDASQRDLIRAGAAADDLQVFPEVVLPRRPTQAE
jgi:hypothetical protein